jgi:hypothetical protein
MIDLERTADELIPGSSRRSPSYHSEYGRKTVGEILELARRGDRKARQMKKLIFEDPRLSQRPPKRR